MNFLCRIADQIIVWLKTNLIKFKPPVVFKNFLNLYFNTFLIKTGAKTD